MPNIMKALIRLSIIVMALIFMSTECQKEDEINPNDPTGIQDMAFLHALIRQGVDINGDSIISYAEAELVTCLNFSYVPHSDEPVIPAEVCNISCLKGIEAFINLESLNGACNDIKELDVSKNTKLKYLNCKDCGLTELNVSVSTRLEYLDCSHNYMRELDVSENTKLKYLDCYGWCTLGVHSYGIMEYLEYFKLYKTC